MRIVVALGGNALLKRGQPMTAEAQRENVRTAARALAGLCADHDVVITHGNGPQVGLLALQGAAYRPDEAYPLDVLGAETEGMIGYMIEQELGNLLPEDRPLATLLTMIEVDPHDPAFAEPTKFIGPIYTRAKAQALAAERGWIVKPDGEHWRRVVPSPLPKRIFELRPIEWLLERNTVVVCAGGGGIPTWYASDGNLEGVEAVIDKDFASELLARELGADLFIMATDVDAVYRDWNTPSARPVRSVHHEQIDPGDFPAGSMGPKVSAARLFARETGRRAAIGALGDLGGMVAGTAGTSVWGEPSSSS